MERPDEEIVLLSALQHYAYCPRQFALIHLEQVWDENLFTLRGRRVHETVDRGHPSMSAEGRIERGLPMWSHRHGLSGKADCVVFPRQGAPFPVEYKAGTARGLAADRIQLCAQAFCLEEMFDTRVGIGYLYYHRSRSRSAIEMDPELRAATEETIQHVRMIQKQGTTPPPVADNRCPPCSLIDACLPFVVKGLQEGDL